MFNIDPDVLEPRATIVNKVHKKSNSHGRMKLGFLEVENVDHGKFAGTSLNGKPHGFGVLEFKP